MPQLPSIYVYISLWLSQHLQINDPFKRVKSLVFDTTNSKFCQITSVGINNLNEAQQTYENLVIFE